MSVKGKSLISVNDLSDGDIQAIFQRARLFKERQKAGQPLQKILSLGEPGAQKAFLLFAEPSTRTRISFELACHSLCIIPIVFSDIKSSSMTKGESLEETISTFRHFDPALIILRYNRSRVHFETAIPVVNAGFGSYEHPTQALIDAFSIQESRGKIKGEKILIVGDVLHSRVSNSNLKLLRRMGAEVAFCSPMSLFPKGDLWKGVKRFESLNEGTEWASVVMCLRIQQERHDMSIGLSIAEYRDFYHFGAKQLEILRKDGVILHPGPYICGVEIDAQTLKDPRSRIMAQVECSPAIRTAALSLILGFELKEGS